MAKKKTTTDSPEAIELFEIIADQFPDADGFNGVVVRSAPTKWANKSNFFSGVGAAGSGGAGIDQDLV